MRKRGIAHDAPGARCMIMASLDRDPAARTITKPVWASVRSSPRSELRSGFASHALVARPIELTACRTTPPKQSRRPMPGQLRACRVAPRPVRLAETMMSPTSASTPVTARAELARALGSSSLAVAIALVSAPPGSTRGYQTTSAFECQRGQRTKANRSSSPE